MSYIGIFKSSVYATVLSRVVQMKFMCHYSQQLQSLIWLVHLQSELLDVLITCNMRNPPSRTSKKKAGEAGVQTLYAVNRKQGCQLQIQETARSGSCSPSRQRMKCNATQQGWWGLACYLKTWQDRYRGEGVSIPNACAACHILSIMAVNVATQHWSPLQRRGFIPSVCKWIKTAKRWILWVIMAESLCKRGFCVVWNRRSGENRGNSCFTPEATFVFLAGNKLWVQGCVFFVEGWKQSR